MFPKLVSRFASEVAQKFGNGAVRLLSYLTVFLFKLFLSIRVFPLRNNLLMPVICPNKIHLLKRELLGVAQNLFPPYILLGNNNTLNSS